MEMGGTMEILAYGEDALTLWGLKYQLSAILSRLNDPSSPSQCQVFFRPSFGRAGGDKSAQFGEFDFIILSDASLYLGESKWDRSSEQIVGGVLSLRPEQLLRHRLFRCLVQAWLAGHYTSWSDFMVPAAVILQGEGLYKPVAPENSLLAENLEMVFNLIKDHYNSTPQIKNLLLYFYCASNQTAAFLPQKAGNDFYVVSLDYSTAVQGNFIRINL